MKSSGHTTEETVLLKAFKYFDLDNSGCCSKKEFLRTISKIGITGFSDENLLELFDIYDVDQSGELDYKEFVGELFGNNSIINERRNAKQSSAKKASQPVLHEKVQGEKTKQEYIDDEEIDVILSKIRAKLASRGVRGIISIGKNFRIIDDNNSQTIDFDEFSKAAKDFRFGLTAEEVEKAFVAFDRKNTGTIDYDEFLRTIRGNMNDFRRALVEQAFNILDKTKSGVIEMEDIKALYNARNHPDVKSGKKNEDEILLEFLETFEENHNYLNGTESDGKVTLEEFMEYYEDVSMSIDDDAYFEDNDGDGRSYYIWLKDFKISAVLGNPYQDVDFDSDTVYTNIINYDYVNELSDINFKICTWDNKKPNYSAVAYKENSKMFYLDKTINSALSTYESNTLEDSDTTNGLRQEEHLICRLVNQY